jgi:hypothetical protein
MTTTSISNIKSSLATLQENLPGFRKYLKENYTESMDEGQWGDEKEYSPNGILSGLNNIITDLTSLVENPKTFILLSTYKERRDIHEYLSYLSNETNNCYSSNIASRLDSLKKILRPYNLRTDKNRMIVYQQKIDELTKQAEHLTQVLEKAREQEKNINEIYSLVSEQSDSISRKDESISALLKQSKETKEELDELQEELGNVAAEIRTLNTASSDAKDKTLDNKAKVEAFVEEIGEHQKNIEKQDAQFEKFKTTLEENSSKQQEYLAEACNLIEKSKLALSYTTSVGLGSSFDAQCKEIKGWKSFKLWSWLVASAIGVIGVICIGVWLIYGNHHANDGNVTSMWLQIIGKISMIPLLVTTIVFCANQYGKQKNLLEDYSYKLALAKSMVAFSEELREKDSERYKEYLSTVLNEILKDPLRIRIDPNKNKTTKGEVLLSNESFATFGKIISLIQQASHTS